MNLFLLALGQNCRPQLSLKVCQGRLVEILAFVEDRFREHKSPGVIDGINGDERRALEVKGGKAATLILITADDDVIIAL